MVGLLLSVPVCAQGDGEAAVCGGGTGDPMHPAHIVPSEGHVGQNKKDS